MIAGNEALNTTKDAALYVGQSDRVLIDPFPDANRIVRNVVLKNGSAATGNPQLDALRGDLVWDDTGTGNCWALNRTRVSVRQGAPGRAG